MRQEIQGFVDIVVRNKELLAACNGDSPHGQWLAVDLDGTLAQYHGWVSEEHIGEPVVSIVAAINARRAAGWKVAIFTARVSGDAGESYRAEAAIWKWLDFYNIKVEGITCTKHKHFSEFWDDRARQVIFNKGLFVQELNHDHVTSLDGGCDKGAGLDLIIEKAAIPDVEYSWHAEHLEQVLARITKENIHGEIGGNIGCSLDVQIGGSHYKDMVIQPAEYCEYNNIPALEASVIKYVSRHMNKNGVQDLEKAKDLINMIIEMRYEPTGLNHLAARINSKRHNKFEGK